MLKAEPLGHAGIGIAGDAFDYRIVDKVVSPRLGKGGIYRSMDKILSIPNHYYANFARWNQLAHDEGQRRSEGAARARPRCARTRRRWRSSSTSSNTISALRSTAPSPPPRWRCRARTRPMFRFPGRGRRHSGDDHARPISRAGSPTDVGADRATRSTQALAKAGVETGQRSSGCSSPAARPSSLPSAKLFVDRFGETG